MRNDRDRLLDMVEMCDLLIAHASDPDVLATDPVVQAAAQRWIEVLGEAASHLSDQLRSAHPEIPWREIVGTRVILAHAYFHIDQDIIGDLVQRDIPALRRQLQQVLDNDQSD
ncbi:HepT-like ribonuclease domain-containing protein [Ilumatobacter coccineus]|uniref:DUF86 domain-containing protein n=1 Tax=Ilumatobacter coccineus (strain NBRC 103263 / KCTC 29153 / YM16-304) TaxID=1313172 RepID=A0A6C7EBD4_ILUCY|nr:HepT-like ribonuclease domain-containing protein [Ilumatobacter coccineus]BAN03791.1 hypothetical protein YM304_34770 [Ilumatobacter coccineus YM16-304]